MSMNSVHLIGRVVASPERRNTTNNIAVVNFALAVDRNYKNKDGEYETDFFNMAAFGDTATFIERWFDKGNVIAIDGHLVQNRYEDKEGNKRSYTDIIIDRAYFAGSEYTDHAKKNNRRK